MTRRGHPGTPRELTSLAPDRAVPCRTAAPVRPPRLQTDSSRTASRFELFFDLAFVLVVAELATGLSDDPQTGRAPRTDH